MKKHTFIKKWDFILVIIGIEILITIFKIPKEPFTLFIVAAGFFIFNIGLIVLRAVIKSKSILTHVCPHTNVCSFRQCYHYYNHTYNEKDCNRSSCMLGNTKKPCVKDRRKKENGTYHTNSSR